MLCSNNTIVLGTRPWDSPEIRFPAGRRDPRAGGEKEECGWLKGMYGVSWQIVPAVIGELMSDPDPVKSERVTQALLQMKKIEITGLKKAYEEDKAA
jgi:hypothetical protein